MAFNGAGTFQLVTGNPVVSGTTVSPTVHNNTNSDIANGLTNCVTRDGQSPLTSNLPMGGFKLTGLSAGTANGHSVRYEELIAEESARIAADALLAPLASPSLTGVPLAPTAAPGTNTTQIATTAFVAAKSTEYVALTGAQVVAGVKTLADNLQINNHATATNNFVISTDGAGGLKVSRGNDGATTQDVLTVDASGKVTLADSAMLGVGQTWQNVLASRAVNTDYTNTSGKPIVVSYTTAGSTPTVSIVVGGVTVASYVDSATTNLWISAIVPNGSVYRVNSNDTTGQTWVELR